MAQDIDRVIEKVRAAFPGVKVDPLTRIFPADDDGVWFFSLPGIPGEIQVESNKGARPFLVEHAEMRSPAEALVGAGVEEAAGAVIGYLEKALAAAASEGEAPARGR